MADAIASTNSVEELSAVRFQSLVERIAAMWAVELQLQYPGQESLPYGHTNGVIGHTKPRIWSTFFTGPDTKEKTRPAFLRGPRDLERLFGEERNSSQQLLSSRATAL